MYVKDILVLFNKNNTKMNTTGTGFIHVDKIVLNDIIGLILS